MIGRAENSEFVSSMFPPANGGSSRGNKTHCIPCGLPLSAYCFQRVIKLLQCSLPVSLLSAMTCPEVNNS